MKRGRLRQSVCRWCYAKIPLEILRRAAARATPSTSGHRRSGSRAGTGSSADRVPGQVRSVPTF